MAFSKPLLLSGLIAFALFVFFASVPILHSTKLVPFSRSSTPPSPVDNEIRAPRQNVWADLSQEEAEGVKKFVFSRPDLNLTEAAKASPFQNTLKLIEVLKPNKTDVLSYLSGLTEAPERWARVVINEAVDSARIVNFMVGPLPVKPSTEILPLNYCFNSDRNYVSNPDPGYLVLGEWMASFAGNHSDVIIGLLGGVIDINDPDSLGAQATSTTVGTGSLIAWIQIYRQSVYSSAVTLMPQGLYIKVDITSKDIKDWIASTCYYNGRVHNSMNDLRKAMKSPDFVKVPINAPGNWTDTEEFEDGLPGRNKPPPVMIQPGGSRFLVDKEQKFVSYMGFEFYISMMSDTGMSLHDIRFLGDSVIYEVGLQEAMAHYAGDDPQQGGLEFLDTSFMMGKNTFELLPGYDCPAYATYLPAVYTYEDSTIVRNNSICIFEYTADHALQRHTAANHVTASRNTYLVVRSVSTMGNYDYTIDYIFYLDGSIEVKVRASGYIFAAFWAEGKEDEYGYRIHDAIASSMHDHVINFKADLDIIGTQNTLMRVGIEPITMDYPWDDEKTGPRNTMHLVHRPFETETGFGWPKNAGEMFIVVNDKETNAWGENRGYRIAAGTGMGNPSHLTILNSTTLGVSAEWANNDLWVVKRKDTEPMSASALNFYEPRTPLVDFSKFVDGENLINEDLVIYFNLGSHHVPHSGDLPNTLMHTSASSVMFTPFNFNDRDPSRRSSQGVRVDKKNGQSTPRYFGATYDKGVTLEATDLEPTLSKFFALEQMFKNQTWVPGWIGTIGI